ncbi:MAG: hypothetical protein OYH76_06730 [Defluviicoccus sp.]|nr:hypothetical protein [Defluviicoccus sp.]
MTPDQRDELDSLLFDQGNELVNIKFLPGTKRGLSSSEFRREAASVLKEVRSREPDAPPATGVEKTVIEEFIASA